MARTEGERARDVFEHWKFYNTMWKGKRLEEMTDQDCIDCLRYISETTGVHYVRLYSDIGN